MRVSAAWFERKLALASPFFDTLLSSLFLQDTLMVAGQVKREKQKEAKDDSKRPANMTKTQRDVGTDG